MPIAIVSKDLLHSNKSITQRYIDSISNTNKMKNSELKADKLIYLNNRKLKLWFLTNYIYLCHTSAYFNHGNNKLDWR